MTRCMHVTLNTITNIYLIGINILAAKSAKIVSKNAEKMK